jgi:hypothetical protein
VLAPHELALEVDRDKSVENRHVERDDVHVESGGRGVRRVVVHTSRPPNDSTAASTMRTMLDSSEMSTSAAIAFSSPAATRSAAALSMSATTTDAPSRTIKRAVASPIPLPAPVTIATLPSRRPTGAEYARAGPDVGPRAFLREGRSST